MFFLRRKPRTDRDKLLSLAAAWRDFGAVELDRPGLERELRALADRLEQETPLLKPLLRQAVENGSAVDVDFLFEFLAELPPAPDASAPAPDQPDFAWERVETELGAVARVVNGIRVAIQSGIRQHWQKQIKPFERRSQLTGAPPPPELARILEAERDDLTRVDRTFRVYLFQLDKLHELYRAALDALARLKNPDGIAEVKLALRSDDRRYRDLAVKVLQRQHWQPASAGEKLDFLLVKARMPETEAEALRGILELIRGTTDVKELLELIEPRLAEEGLTQPQARLLEHVCSLHSAAALDRLAAVLASSLEPPELKAKVCAALPEFGTPRAVQLLVTALDEIDTEVRTAAAEALGRVGKLSRNWPATDDLAPALDSAQARLVFALRDGDVSVREAASRALRHYPGAAPGLLTYLLQDRNPNAREYAGHALSLFPTEPDTTEALLKALADEDAAVRKAAAGALAKQGQVPDDPELKIRFLCAAANWKELRRLGPAATACLVGLLRDRNEEIRQAVVETLGEIRAREAVHELGISLADSQQEIRRAAALALRLIGDPAALDALRTALPKEGFKEVRSEIEKAIRKLETRTPEASSRSL